MVPAPTTPRKEIKMKIFKFKLSTRIGSTAREWLVAKAAASQARRDIEAITRALIADAPRNIRDRLAQLEVELKAAEATAKAYEPDLRDLPHGSHVVPGVGSVERGFRSEAETLRAKIN
jgi:hypothetical protein